MFKSKFKYLLVPLTLALLSFAFLFSLNFFENIFPNTTKERKDVSKLADKDPLINRFPSTAIGDCKCKQELWPDPIGVLLSLGIRPNMVTLDLCCGDGYFTIPLSKISAKTYGLELDPSLIKVAIKEAEQQKITTCEWIQGDARNLKDLIKEKVDFVLLANTLHGVPDKESLIKDIFAILKPNGLLAIINWHKKPEEKTIVLDHPCGPQYELRMSPKQVQKIVKPQGFKLKKIIEFPPHHYGIIFIRLD
jgi:2-polyprenyl-3-methyl-5-hydroxy-6-metoxy-1,4-benzoquinol methylase